MNEIQESLSDLFATLELQIEAYITRHDRICAALADFYRAPLSMSSVQPILDLAVELNPDLKGHADGNL